MKPNTKASSRPAAGGNGAVIPLRGMKTNEGDTTRYATAEN